MALDNIKSYMIGVVLGIAIIMSGVFMIGKFSTSSTTTLDPTGDIAEFNRTLALSENITNSVNNLDSSLIEPEKAGTLGWIDGLFKSAFGGIKAVKNTMGFVGTATTDSARVFGIEEALPIIAVILLVITIIILIALYEAITRQ